MNWNGKELDTYGKVADAMGSIYKSGNQDDADEFMRLMREEGEHADSNIGYITGYFSADTADGMRKMFGVRHPIFGLGHPKTPEEAIQAGIDLAKKHIKEKG